MAYESTETHEAQFCGSIPKRWMSADINKHKL